MNVAASQMRGDFRKRASDSVPVEALEPEKGKFMLEGSREGSFASIAVLIQKVGLEGFAEVIHEGGYVWKPYFKFSPPATEDSLNEVEKKLGLPLPVVYRQFLHQHDGALLYYDNEYGQWGFLLYGTENLVIKNLQWKKRYDTDWRPTFFAFAESMGDADLLLFDLGQPINDGQDCIVIDGDSGYRVHNWTAAAPSFSKWIDWLVVAQGAKYWRWR